jgi:hypothetical protein
VAAGTWSAAEKLMQVVAQGAPCTEFAAVVSRFDVTPFTAEVVADLSAGRAR